jgi:acyl transferase domain-containing protein/SAM-dependent methyltransferase
MNRSLDAEQLSPLKRAILELREMRSQLAEMDRRQREPIAVVGMGLRLPGGAHDEISLWQLLADGLDTVSEIPSSRWNLDAYYDPDPDRRGKMHTRHGSFLNDVDQFDAEFFGVSPREAVSMDPQHRLLMECSWEALENAVIAPLSLRGSSTGVFVGIGNNDYWRMVYSDTQQIDAYSALGNSYSVAAGRLSYFLGVHGPSMAIDTACSASLVAVHLACQSLRAGECSLALAGGVNLILSPEANINFSKSRMLAPDGRCKTFDAAADGYVRGEGCGVVVLKPLSTAQADANRILAVIRGSAVNQDGHSGGLTAPNGPAQEAVIRAALEASGVNAAEVSYLEAHGTGTSLGDPIEVRAAAAVLCQDRSANCPLTVGSIKTNIGHLEAAAGVAGLLKVILALQQKQFPPHLHLKHRNPYIDWDHLPIAIPTKLTRWEPVNGKRIAGLSSFGFSGTNAHLVLEEPQETTKSQNVVERPVHILTLSAKSRDGLNQLAQAVAQEVESKTELADICFSLNAGRSHFGQRVAILGKNTDEIRERLRAFVDQQAVTNVVAGEVIDLRSPSVAFLFTGQGSQYLGMGRELYGASPVFRKTLDRCAEILRPHLEMPLLSVLYPEPSEKSLLDNTAYAQPAIFAIEYALSEMWSSWGVRPAFVMGHSAGEYIAACVAGVFCLEDGLRLIAERGRLIASLPKGGRMAVVFAGRERVESAIACFSAVSIAAINDPEVVTISGEAEQVQAVLARLAGAGIKSKDLTVSYAFHSSLLDPILDSFATVASTVHYAAPKIGFVSNLTGKLAERGLIDRADYWRRHARETVQFATGVQTLKEQNVKVFLEVGPSPALLSMARRCLPEEGHLWLPSLRPGRGDWLQMLESLQALYIAGAEIDWAGVDRGYSRARLVLPTYPFQRRGYWLERTGNREKTAEPENCWRAAGKAGLRQSQQAPIGVNVETYPDKWSCLERLTTAHVATTLRSLGAFAYSGESHDVQSLLDRFEIPVMYNRLLQRWLERSAAAGILRTDGARFVSDRPLADPNLASCIGEAEQKLADDPDLLAYLRNCGEKLSLVIAGKENPLETLFPGGSSLLAERLYANANINRYANAIACSAVEAAAQASTVDRPFRILEVGAGTGGTSSTLLPLLDPDRAEYWFTDVSELFLTRARERFAGFPFASFAIFDLEKDSAAQGFSSHSFDVIVATNTVHAVRDLDEALKRLRALLVSGGFLLLVEVTRHHGWFDITTGMIEGWQHFADVRRRNHPLLAPEQWRAVLEENGFSDVIIFPEIGSPAEVLGQHVILAHSAASVDQNSAETCSSISVSRAERVMDAAPASSGPVSDESIREFRRHLESALPDEQEELMNEYVRRRVTEVLRLAPDQRPGIQHRLMDLGLDSLMAIQLRNLLESGLGLDRSLPATLMFDYPTIASISAFLLKCIPGESDSVAPVTAVKEELAKSALVRAREIEALSDEEAEALLLKRLEGSDPGSE